MRVVSIIHQFPPGFQTGTEMLCLRTFQALSARGYATLVVTADPSRDGSQAPHRSVVEGIETVYIPTRMHARGDVISRLRFYSQGRNADRLLEEAQSWRPDIIHIHHVAQFGLRAVRQLAGIAPVVFTATDFHLVCPYSTALLPNGGECGGPDDSDSNCLAHHRLRPQHHGLRPPSLASQLVRSVRRLYESSRDPGALAAVAEVRRDRLEAFASAKVVIAGSERMRAMFLGAGAKPDNLILIPHEAPPIELPERPLGKRLTLGFHGTLSAHKGAHVLLESLRILPPNLDFAVIVQGDIKGDPKYVARLRELAQGDKRIEFRASVSYEEYGRSLAEIDVLIMPSIWAENRPLTLLSAIESGRYVVGSKVPGIEAALLDPVYGCLVPPNDPKALAARLSQLLADPSPILTARMRRREPPKFSGYVDALERIYHRLSRDTEPIAGAATRFSA